MGMEFRIGIIISSFLILFPIVLCFGMVSPILIRILTFKADEAGKTAGSIYAISTVGGIFFAVVTGLYFIPEWGLQQTSFFITLILFFITVIAFITTKKHII
jgi:predicted membrane-bound spermidine synthase